MSTATPSSGRQRPALRGFAASSWAALPPLERQPAFLRSDALPSPSVQSLMHLRINQRRLKLVDGIGLSNGLMYDAKRRTLYCNDTFNCTWAFDVQADLMLTDKKMLVDKEDVDGMALDAGGNLWITGFRSNSLTRVRPDGSALSPIETPADAITQIRFGGPDMSDFYITSVPADGGDNLKDGEMPTEKNSILYRGRSQIPGMPIEPARFKID